MNKNFFKIFFLIIFFHIFLFASKVETSQTQLNKLNSEITNLKLVNEYEKKLNEEKLKIFFSKIVEKENEIKELKKEFKELEDKFNKNNIDKEKIQKDFENNKIIIDRQDKRVEDLHSNISFWGVVFTLVGTLTAIIVIAFTLRFGSIATNEAKEELQKWIDEKADKEFQPKVDKYLMQLEKETKELLLKIKANADNKIDSFISGFVNNKLNNVESNYENLFNYIMEEYNKGNIEEAFKYIEKTISISKNDDELSKSLFIKAEILKKLNQKEEALNIYDKLIENFSTSKNKNVLNQVKNALINKAYELSLIDKSEDTLKIYNELLNNFSELLNLEEKAFILINKGYLFTLSAETKKSLECYEKVILDFSNIKDNLTIVSYVIYSSVNKANILWEIDKNSSLEIYNNLIENYKTSSNILIQRQLINAYLNKAFNVGKEDKKRAIELYNKAIEKYKETNDEVLISRLFSGYINKAIYLVDYDKEKAIELYDEVIEQSKDFNNIEIIEQKLNALVNKITLITNKEKAIELYDSLINEYKEFNDIRICYIVNIAYINKASLLKNENAILCYDEVIIRFNNSNNLKIKEQFIKANIYKASVLHNLKEPYKAKDIYSKIIDAFKESKDRAILNNVLLALINKIELNIILNHENLPEDIELFKDLVNENKEKLMQLEMLQILEKAKIITQDNEIKQWQEKYKDMSLNNWSFDDLDTWIETLEEEPKQRLEKYLAIFKEYK